MLFMFINASSWQEFVYMENKPNNLIFCSTLEQLQEITKGRDPDSYMIRFCSEY